jgi:membrane protease YdiL (CAAX protease family)
MRRSCSSVLWFFVFAYVITGVGMCVNFLAFRRLPGGTPINSQTLPWLPYAPYVLWAGPCLASLLMTLFLYGLRGVGRLALRLCPWSVGRAWPVLAVCLLLPLGVVVLPVKILAALAVSVPHLSWEGWPHYLYGAVIGEGLIGPGLFEEIGWRGFALPYLQRRYSALVSSLIIGLVWAFWHFPNFFFFTPTMLAVFVPMGIVMSVIYTWVYNSTGGSLFAVVVLHGATIAPGKLFAGGDARGSLPRGVITGLLCVVIAVWLVWRYGAANLSWRDRVVAEPPNQALHLTGAASALSEGHRHWGGPGR